MTLNETKGFTSGEPFCPFVRVRRRVLRKGRKSRENNRFFEKVLAFFNGLCYNTNVVEINNKGCEDLANPSKDGAPDQVLWLLFRVIDRRKMRVFVSALFFCERLLFSTMQGDRAVASLFDGGGHTGKTLIFPSFIARRHIP